MNLPHVRLEGTIASCIMDHIVKGHRVEEAPTLMRDIAAKVEQAEAAATCVAVAVEQALKDEAKEKPKRNSRPTGDPFKPAPGPDRP